MPAIRHPRRRRRSTPPWVVSSTNVFEDPVARDMDENNVGDVAGFEGKGDAHNLCSSSFFPETGIRAETFYSSPCWILEVGIDDGLIASQRHFVPLSIESEFLVKYSVRVSLRKVIEFPTFFSLAVAALERERSNVAVFVIGARECEEKVYSAVSCTASLLGSDKRVHYSMNDLC